MAGGTAGLVSVLRGSLRAGRGRVGRSGPQGLSDAGEPAEHSRELVGPGPAGGEFDDGAAAAVDDPGGGAQQPVTQMLRVTIDALIEATLQPVKLLKRIRKSCRKPGSRFVIQSFGFDEPGTCCGIPESPSKVPNSLRVIVRGLATGCVGACNSQSSESDVVHDHIRLGEHEIAAIT